MLLCWKGKQSKLINLWEAHWGALRVPVSPQASVQRAPAKEIICELRLWKLPSAWMSPSQHLQNWGVVNDGRKEGSLQERSWSHVEGAVPHWHLVPPAVRTAKSRSGTTCSHLAQAAFNYTWYRHYSSEWSHTRKEEKSRVGVALQGQGRRLLGWNRFVLIYSYISTGMCNFLYTSALLSTSEMIQKDLSSSFFPFKEDTWA